LARHPKKKGDEKPDNDDNKDNPAGSTQTEESKIKSGLDKVFWIRVGLGVLAGALSAIIGEPITIESNRVILGFGIMIALFIVSYMIAKGMKIPIAITEKKKLVTTGYGSWILVNTLIHPNLAITTVR
jgi:hypothetical protein